MFILSQFCNAIDSFSAYDAFMCQRIRSALGQVMACSLFEAKPYWLVNSWTCRRKLKKLKQSTKLPQLLNMSSANVCHFVQGKNRWTIRSHIMRHTIYKVFVVTRNYYTVQKAATIISPSPFHEYGNIHLPASLVRRPFTSSRLVHIISSINNHPIHNTYPCSWGMQCLVHPREPLQCQRLFSIATSTLAESV